MRLDASSLDQRRVGGDLLFNERIELGWCHHHRIDAKCDELVPHLRRSQRFDGLVVQLLKMARGVFAGRNIPIQNGYSASVKPASEVVGTSGSAAERLALFTTSAVSLPSFTNGKAFPTGAKKKSIRPAMISAHYFRPTLEWHMHGLHAGAGLESYGAEMRCGPDASRAEVQNAWLCLGRSHEIGHRLETAGRRNHQDARRKAERDDRRKIPHRIETQARIERRRDRVRGRVDEYGVAIGICLGD